MAEEAKLEAQADRVAEVVSLSKGFQALEEVVKKDDAIMKQAHAYNRLSTAVLSLEDALLRGEAKQELEAVKRAAREAGDAFVLKLLEGLPASVVDRLGRTEPVPTEPAAGGWESGLQQSLTAQLTDWVRRGVAWRVASGVGGGVFRGHEYELPLSREEPQPRPAAEHTLQYLSGFFDGDGCVTPRSDLRSCSLSVGQVAANAEILVRFRDAFGGAICRQKDGRGLQRPMVRWDAYGAEGKQAARFFDAEGCIVVNPCHSAVCLVLQQATAALVPPNSGLLGDVLAKAFRQVYVLDGEDVRMPEETETARNLRVLGSVAKMENVAEALPRLEGLSGSCKKRAAAATAAAREVLQLRRHRCDAVAAVAREIRASPEEKLANYAARGETQFSAFGRQYELPLKKADLKDETTPEVNLEYLSGFFDGDGCVTPASAKQQQLDQLREEHAFLKLGTAYRMLRADIRTGLAEGAILAPFP
ncbi:unnamed protein product [Effrenium voratum]|nr:unnamed protein product [Effrenium voratum]